jgi:DDE superfamily endonuclease
VICLDEMEPKSAKSTPGNWLVRAQTQAQAAGGVRAAERARQEADCGRRGKSYLFGAFCPAAGDAFTKSWERRTTANWLDFLAHVSTWLLTDCEQVYAIVDHLRAHRAPEVLLRLLAYPPWKFIFQPKYAAYGNPIEPWWKVLRSLALEGRHVETWEGFCRAVAAATAY